MADYNPPESGSRPSDAPIALPAMEARKLWSTVKGNGRKAKPSGELTYRPRRRGSPTTIAGTAFARVTDECPTEV